MVILDLDVSNDEVGAIFADGVSINTKNIKNLKVTVENGGTVVLGGVYRQKNQQETTNKVPLLGDLPVVGHLFKSNTRTQARKELLVFITPKIIDEQVQALARIEGDDVVFLPLVIAGIWGIVPTECVTRDM